ncbi:MAG TPA: threonylcarbamoyl-AMP synthase [Candidatus Altiarchaeales archaeon]|nr:threonylcarbamoyl-AMP synthase [Candidatus Altiarchaeales archaeon]
MRILKINPDKPEDDLVLIVARYLRNGKILVYPTDTVYGLGCSINSDNIRRIFDVKRRDRKNPLSVAFPDMEMLKKYVFLGNKEEKFIRKHIDEPYTFVVRKRDSIPDIVTSGRDTVGARIPNLRITREIIKMANTPIITTSANISGKEAPADFNEIDERIKRMADLLIDSCKCRVGKPSRIIDLVRDKVIRELN